MERPKLEKPRLQQYANDDEQMSEMLSHLQHKVLNANEWKLYEAAYDKEITYKDILKNIAGDSYPDKMWIEAMRSFIRLLPVKLDKINGDINTVMRRFILNLQERSSYLVEFEEYADFIETENKELKERIAELEKLELVRGYDDQIADINKRLAELEKPKFPILPDIADDEEEVIEEKQEEVVEEEPKPQVHLPKSKKKNEIKHESVTDKWGDLS